MGYYKINKQLPFNISLLLLFLAVLIIAPYSGVSADREWNRTPEECNRLDDPDDRQDCLDWAEENPGGVPDTVFEGSGPLGSGEDLGLPDVLLRNTEGILGLLFMLVGVLATIFIVIGGARFVFAAGNPDQIKQAKNTIIYAVVGLVVAILASVIVNFVISSTV